MTIGVLGDSVTAGQDNCYYDAWPEVLRRTLSPIMGAMGVELDVRNAGKNGGWNLASQMMCAHDMLGASSTAEGRLDFLYQTNPFVSATGVDAEHMIRRAVLGDGAVVSIVSQKTNMIDLKPYFGLGLTRANSYGDSPPEMGTARDGHKYKFWFPARDRAFWGMQGDGFCHLVSFPSLFLLRASSLLLGPLSSLNVRSSAPLCEQTTRGGSSSVVNRNWHVSLFALPFLSRPRMSRKPSGLFCFSHRTFAAPCDDRQNRAVGSEGPRDLRRRLRASLGEGDGEGDRRPGGGDIAPGPGRGAGHAGDPQQDRNEGQVQLAGP